MSKKTDTVKVILNRPGVRACGQYKAGQEYEVDAAEGERLVKAKGFTYVSAAAQRSKTINTETSSEE